ncbi:hypothetical protein AVEN_1195-1 [Araneus ventricosus]|uniref:Uncharacterized protein n=1 Tax=Araneus ventricosus TaxID=182803 RepID=A0A4Y2RNJ0_ARAVE|nr:hypothetical protein AVEN_274800-1 [Araneus ventricosus]GBN77341.1 hypothetical protein AVEN_131488-1 [Araneus ventricosus]GBN77377.1 hypothetical protein AVEN_190145-1 [Araneus ventricosus]GBN77382.1 hypothetical protein AVEN_1195-1 [Araneus ventricosus]
MDISFVPSLEHASCQKIVMSLLSDSDLKWRDADDYHKIKSRVTEKISKLIPCNLLQRKLEKFIAPLLFEVRKWAMFCEKNWAGLEIRSCRVRDTIPQCRLRDGTIDREKCMNLLVKNRDINPLNRFIMACTFCMFEDVLDLWNSLLRIEKGYLRNRCSTSSDISYFIIRHWIEWLESSTDKDWESFAAWALETPVWKSNIFMLKRVLQTLSPAEKSQRLLKALTGGEVSSDMMRFGLSIMSEDEREVIFRESPLEVFKCILSWPLRNVFIDFASKLWPYVTEDTFCEILYNILRMIKNERFEYVELLVILKSFWAQSPNHYKKFAEQDSYLCGPLNYVLEYDFAQQFQRDGFLRKF